MEAEELFDLILYRPLAHPLVLGLTPTPVTPNMVTLVTFLITLVAGVLYWMATQPAVLAAGVIYFASRVLDCVDGQLARAQGSGSRLGQLYDGLSDYFGHAAVMVGMGFAFGAGELSRSLSLFDRVSLPAWAWAVLAGGSLVYQCILADKYKTEYLTRKFPNRKAPTEELRELVEERESLSGLKRLLYTILIGYLRLQNPAGKAAASETESDRARELYCRRNRATLFAWNLLGPSMHANLIVLFSVIGRLELYIPATIVVMNLASLPLHLWQAGVNRGTRARLDAEDEPSPPQDRSRGQDPSPEA